MALAAKRFFRCRPTLAARLNRYAFGANIMSLIASSLTGRIRLRAAALREPARLERLRAMAMQWRGVREVCVNPKAGSLLIHYDPARLDRARFDARAEALVAQMLGTDTAPAASSALAEPRPSHGSARIRANRHAKRGMLASLAASLLLAGMGRSRWHALTGVFFLHTLAVHLWVHRRHLLR